MASRTYIDDILEAVVFAPGWTFWDMRGMPNLGRYYNQSYHRGCEAGLSASLKFDGPTQISWIAPTSSDSGIVKAFIDDIPSTCCELWPG